MPSDRDMRSRRRSFIRMRPGGAQRILAWSAIFAAVASVIFIQQIAVGEAMAAAFWLNPLLPGGVIASRDNFVVGVEGVPIAFHVTAGCSAAVLLAPALVFYGATLRLRRITFGRALAAALVMITVIFTTNQLRLGLIAWASQTWGMDLGYQVSHRYVGSALAIVGFCAGIALLFLITSGHRRRHQRTAVA